MSAGSAPVRPRRPHLVEEPALAVPPASAYGAEILSASLSALLVSPLVKIIDQAIFENASGKMRMVPSIVESLKGFVTRPVAFFRSPAYLWVFVLYAGTYSTANVVERAYTRRQRDWFYPKFVASSAANVTLSMAKDSVFARAFGTTAPRTVPLATYGFFIGRDCITIGGSFNLPLVLSPYLQHHYGLSKTVADVGAQLFSPLFVQLFNTPFQLLGMDFYNHQDVSWAERLAFVRRTYLATLVARWARIFPAYGIGGVANKGIRRKINGFAEAHYSAQPISTPAKAH